MHISKISTIPKMIWGIIAAISIAALGFILLSSSWFWICWEVVSAALVTFGCFGEWYLFKMPAKPGEEEPHRSHELQFILVVAIGVAMELLALAHSIPEAVRLEKDVAEIGTTNAQLVASNLILASQVEGLRKENLKLVEAVSKMPHRQVLTYDAAARVIRLLKLASNPKMKVRVLRKGNWYQKKQDSDSIILAQQIVVIFSQAGFDIHSFAELNTVGDGVAVVLKSSPSKQLLAAIRQLFVEIGQKPDIRVGVSVITGPELQADASFDLTVLVAPPPLFDESSLVSTNNP
jgi:hypothetical protein